MPTFDIVKTQPIKESFRIAAIKGQYDLQVQEITERFTGEIPFDDDDWNIGAIIGNSGTGKTVIAQELFQDKIFQPKYSADSVIDDMPADKKITEIAELFNSVGFSSPPSWLKSYAVLSQGEKMRIDLVNAILNTKDIIVFDEFTSTIDRDVAKIGSMALAKYIRRQNKRFIAVSCHFDILDWLQPDWIFDTNFMQFQKKSLFDQKLNYQFTDVTGKCGEFLGNIII